jgi:hypothetical protein
MNVGDVGLQFLVSGNVPINRCKLQRQYYWQYTFLLRSKNSRCKSTCFKRHVPHTRAILPKIIISTNHTSIASYASYASYYPCHRSATHQSTRPSSSRTSSSFVASRLQPIPTVVNADDITNLPPRCIAYHAYRNLVLPHITLHPTTCISYHTATSLRRRLPINTHRCVAYRTSRCVAYRY